MRWLLCFLAFLCVDLSPALACSAREGYRIPSNFELVQRAEVILLARIKEVPPSWREGDEAAQPGLVTLEPVRFLKGSASAADLGLIGWRPPKNWEGVPTATTLAQSHFSAGLGACIRQFYAPGELVVAIFERDARMKAITGRDLNQITDPWARAVETVDHDGDIWVRAVERFVELQKGPASNLNDRVEAEMARSDAIRTPQAQAIASELSWYLNRREPDSAWTSVAMPTGTFASVHGKKGAGLHCAAGIPPGVIFDGPAAASLEIVVDGKSYSAELAKPNPIEDQMLHPKGLTLDPKAARLNLSLYHIANPDKLWSALQTAAVEVRIDREGQQVVAGEPLDALFRWAGQCKKLQGLPAPTEEELRQPAK